MCTEKTTLLITRPDNICAFVLLKEVSFESIDKHNKIKFVLISSYP